AVQPRPHADNGTRRPLLPVEFIANQGQWDPRIDFAVRHGSTSATVEGPTLRLAANASPTARVSLTFEGASNGIAPVGEDLRTTRYNFYLGPDSHRWRSGVPAFAAVAYRNIYPGVAATLHDRAGELEYELRFDAHTASDAVVVRVDGASNVRIAADGALILETSGAALRQSPPTSWEERPDGTRQPVPSRFRKVDDHRYGFEVDGRDLSRPLVIDPGLVWSTFLGGSGADFIGPAVVARDGSGDVFVGGTMTSPDFPSFSDPGFAPGVQSPAFVARLNSTGSAL